MPSELLDLFLSSTEDYGIILLDPQGRVERWSRGAERLFGYSADEIVGTPGHVIFVPPDRKAGVPEVELQQAAVGGRAEDERWHVRKDGSRFWASGVMIALKENGDLRGFAKVVRDFTERRRLDEAVRQTQKLESFGVLAAGVAHDFNNVLTAIFGNISLLRRRLDRNGKDEQSDKLLTGAERAANRAADLVRQLLNYAGKGRRELQPVDICQVVHDALAIVQASVSRKITLRSDVPDACPRIPADVGQLQQLVLNLVLNAVQAMPSGGSLKIVTKPESVRESGAVTHVLVEIKDSGPGLSEEQQKNAFRSLLQTTKKQGTGLGLAIVGKIIEAHHGDISIASGPGKGAVFRVLIPIEQG